VIADIFGADKHIGGDGLLWSDVCHGFAYDPGDEFETLRAMGGRDPLEGNRT
jgi:hypothetical protein